jgi:hypothetical protein
MEIADKMSLLDCNGDGLHATVAKNSDGLQNPSVKSSRVVSKSVSIGIRDVWALSLGVGRF